MPLSDMAPTRSRQAAGNRVEPRQQVKACVNSAVDMATSWRRSSAAERIHLIDQLARRLSQRVTELADLVAREVGKPVRFGRVEIQRTADMLQAIIRRYQAFPAVEPTGSALVRRQPHGTVAVITPWNNPVYIALGKIVPAVLYGNTVVWKPAPEAHAVAKELCGDMALCRWPSRLVNLLAGDDREGEALMADPRIGAVTLTGSPVAGASAQRICGQRLAALQAEVGGNNAAIIWPDADLELAARQVARGAMEQAGQRCTANRRVIVPESCLERFLQLLTQECGSLNWGSPLQEETQIGPLVSAAQLDRVTALVDQAVTECGPPILPQGETRSPECDFREAAFYPPTIFCCDDPAAQIVQEETFGPVLVLQTARDWTQAIELCNGVRQGLAAAVFTQSQEVIDRFLDEAEAGILKINRTTADAEIDVPFGGWKASGVGPPAHGAFDVEFFTRSQIVYGID